MIQYNRATNSGTPTPFSSQTNPQLGSQTNYQRNASGRRGGAFGALIWIVVLFAYLGISRVAAGGSVAVIAAIIIALIVLAAVAAIIVRAAKRGGAAAPRRASQDGHICETPAEHSASERSAADTLDEMEDGYRAYSYSAAETLSHESYVYKRIRKMTAEEYRKKLEELDSLLAAGMMTREEYAAKKREYAVATR